MHIKRLKLDRFRNFDSLDLIFSSKFNYFYGNNGAGKTSVLEAIHYLSTGHSFRTRKHEHVIKHDSDRFGLYLEYEKQGQVNTAGISRGQKGDVKYRMNAKDIKSIVELTKSLPVQILAPDSRKLLLLGPKQRRQFIDWGVFHVEHSFYSFWLEMGRALKQRNALLKRDSVDSEQESIWTQKFVRAAIKVHEMRQQYIESFSSIYRPIIDELLGDMPIEIRYRPGWDQSLSLSDAINKSWHRDHMLKYTQHGPQKADLELLCNGIPVIDILSQGQQKLLLYALLLAQGLYLYRVTEVPCLFLIDDIIAELDDSKLERLFNLLKKMNAQVFLTAVSLPKLGNLIPPEMLSVFHVEQGHIQVEIAPN